MSQSPARPETADAPRYEILPSILAADFTQLGRDVAAAADAGIRTIQVDVMDGRFVPNISVGLPVVRALKRQGAARLDVHLMIEEPERWIEPFAEAGADVLTIHAEATPHLHRGLQRIRDLGLQAGGAINPATPAAALEEVLELLDVALVMTVNPGFGGQAFLPGPLAKVERLAGLFARRGLPGLVQVDGGIGPSTIRAAADAGARQLVAGSAVFGGGVAEVASRVEALRAALPD